MAKQKRRTFVKVIDGSEIVQYAYTPADAVRFVYNGWRERERVAPAAAAPSAGRSATRKAAAETAASADGK